MTVSMTRATLQSTGQPVLKVITPYNPSMPARARELGGKWDAAGKYWLFDVRDEERVAALLERTYGVNPIAPPAPTVAIHFETDKIDLRTDEIYAVGRQILRRPGRDSSVQLGAGVIVIAGGFKSSGGSVNHPKISDQPTGTVLEIRDVPLPLAQAAVEKGWATIVEDAPPPARTLVPSRDGIGSETRGVAALLESFRALSATEQARALELLEQELPS